MIEGRFCEVNRRRRSRRGIRENVPQSSDRIQTPKAKYSELSIVSRNTVGSCNGGIVARFPLARE